MGLAAFANRTGVSLIASMVAIGALRQTAAAQQALPTVYRDHRFYVQPVTTAGDTLLLATDTGGTLFLFVDAAERVGLTVVEAAKLRDYIDPAIPADVLDAIEDRYALLPTFAEEKGIPATLAPWGPLPALPVRVREPDAGQHWGDGLLGQGWFAGRVWTFDYPGRRLLLREAGHLPAYDAAHRVTLGFKASPRGERETNFPRIQVEVAGERIDLLFDTGATTTVTGEALAELADGRPRTRATSFISASTFARWHDLHPEWRVLPRAEAGSGEPMIEARNIRVGGYPIERVWFTRRPDDSFHKSMAALMDRKVDGALGGNALRHFRITVDYPNAVAVFERRE